LINLSVLNPARQLRQPRMLCYRFAAQHGQYGRSLIFRLCRRVSMTKASDALPQPVRSRPPFECIALVLQGGGALGAYQAGVYQALDEAGLHPDWISGYRSALSIPPSLRATRPAPA
jgi:predicted acylesterase/phospholipase RssA